MELGHTVVTYVSVGGDGAEEHRKPDDETVSSFSDYIESLRVPEAAVFIKEARPGAPVSVILVDPKRGMQPLTLQQPEVN
jgi:hypothetical protein